ncbi:MAG: Fe-S protein assembly co-chaperone HscB [Candidatus Rokubacteria bacterium]|nr:Fe-S protein assembly co-chaperone HscB [Candidatus Rokubacteria bacterium]
MNYFEVFCLDRKLGIDAQALQSRFYELSRRWHPDFQQGRTPEAQAEALERSALVNAAYRALRDPIARVEYLVRLAEGRDTKGGAVVKPKAPPELLEEIFELLETLAEARAGGLDDDRRAELAVERDRLVKRLAAEEDRLKGSLATAWDSATPADRPRVLAALKDALAVRAYLRTVIDDLTNALEGQESDAAHHRH